MCVCVCVMCSHCTYWCVPEDTGYRHGQPQRVFVMYIIIIWGRMFVCWKNDVDSFSCWNTYSILPLCTFLYVNLMLKRFFKSLSTVCVLLLESLLRSHPEVWLLLFILCNQPLSFQLSPKLLVFFFFFRQRVTGASIAFWCFLIFLSVSQFRWLTCGWLYCWCFAGMSPI